MKLLRSLCLPLIFFTVVAAAAEPVVLPLWPGDAPGSAGRAAPEKVRVTEQGDHVVSGVHQPTLTVYLPTIATATGAAVIVCPGGGHRELWADHEGHHVARWFAERGIAAFVLKYRLARDSANPPDTAQPYTVEREALADAQRALRLVRSRATEWKIDPARVGIMGFSAGGEVAGLAARNFDLGEGKTTDLIQRESSRPAFQALIYPGRSASIEPAAGNPPAFLLCGYDDRPDISEGLAQVYLRFKQAKVPAELHILTGLGHGFGLRTGATGGAAQWLERMHDWLGERGFLVHPQPTLK